MAFLDRLSVRLQILAESSRRPGKRDSSRNHRPGPQDDTDCVRPGLEAPLLTDAAQVGQDFQFRIRIRNRRFETVLNIETYRLRNRSQGITQDESGSLTKIANQLRPRMESVKFNGDPPLSFLPFLQQLTRVANQSSISEGCLLWVMEDFMLAPTLEAFRSQKIEPFPAAVHWLLSSYAPENSLKTALRSVLAASQSPSETVRMFGLRLQLDASRLEALVSTSELKSLFSQGFNEPTHSLFASYQPTDEMEPHVPLSVLIQRAEQLETGLSSRTSTRFSTVLPSRTLSKVKEVALSELSLSANGSVGTQDQDESEEFDRELELMAISSDRNSNCYVCYRPSHGWITCPLLAHVSDKEK